MYPSEKVKSILSWYEGESPAIKTNLARLLMQGALANTGRLIILPVDQGFEHGPMRSFSPNPQAFDPHYHYRLAIEADLSAYAAPLGMLEAGADTFAGAIPTILKMNSGNKMTRFADEALLSDQAMTASVEDAVRLGCVGVGFTIYPGSDHTYDMFEEVKEMIRKARSYGLISIVWSYARGNMSKAGETALDVISYGAHMAALLGAHIIKVKLPDGLLEYADSPVLYEKSQINISDLSERVAHVMTCAFNKRRLVVFSGGATKDLSDVLEETKAIYAGGGTGSIIGRNAFQRPKEDALDLLKKMVQIYKG